MLCVFLFVSQGLLIKKQRTFNQQLFFYQSTSDLLTSLSISDNKLLDSLSKSSGNHLFLRMENSGCHDCTDSLFHNAVYLTKRFGKDRITVLIGSTFNREDFEMFRRVHRYDLPNILQVPDVSEADKTGRSYYFMLDKKRSEKAFSIFYPDPVDNSVANQMFIHWLEKVY
jgi:hypothetical protein